MLKNWLAILSTVSVVSSCVGPRETDPVRPASQACALQKYLADHPGSKPLLEKDCDPKILEAMRNAFGAGFSPYGRKGDFNRDGQEDFAVILASDAAPEDHPGLADTHRWKHKLTVVVFNGSAEGRWDAAFAQDATAPLACFLDTSKDRQGKLFFGVFETCEGFAIVPVGRGYRTETFE